MEGKQADHMWLINNLIEMGIAFYKVISISDLVEEGTHIFDTVWSH